MAEEEKEVEEITSTMNDNNEHESKAKEYHYERNNSLPELFGDDEAHQQAWEKYWAKNGERLIWQSWIEKYIEYINPEYLDQLDITADSQKYGQDEAFTFEPPPPPPNIGNTEIVISSPAKQSADDLLIEGEWNEITSDSLHNETNIPRYLHQNSTDTENFLLSPRCDSINSSIPFTIGTTDSMTNVTRMTISSYGFESSHVTSESTPTSSSSSSSLKLKDDSDKVSSFSDSEYDSDNQMATTRAAHECEKILMENKPAEHLPSTNDKDSEEYWQKRWQSHAQEQYAKHYNMFMETHRILQEEMSSSFKSDSGFLPGENNAGCSGGGGGSKRRKKSGRKKGSHSLQRLVANLNMKNDLAKLDNPQKNTDDQPTDADNNSHNQNHQQEQSQSDSTIVDVTETSLMESMGLPTTFGRRENRKNGNGGGDEPPDERPVNLKRSHENETDDIQNVDHIKSQFEMMGYAFNDNNNQNNDGGSVMTITKGEIVYRKKHVRLHNRMLKMFTSISRPRHTYFDDDGNEIVEEKEQEQENLLHSSSDEDAPMIQPSTNRINNNSIVPLTSQLSSDGNANDEKEMLEEQVNINLSIDQENDCVEEPIINMNDEEWQQLSSAKKEKKKKRKGKFQTLIPVEIANDKVLKKYWYKRFSLFSMFDQGIQLDRGE